MDAAGQEQQFEFFKPVAQVPARRAAGAIGSMQMRYDHAVLVGIAGLLACSVVFAFGVERGKRVARAEQPLLPPSPASVEAVSAAAATPAAATERPGVKAAAAKAAPAKPVKESSQFAVQVVAFSKPQLAQRELQRLRQQGESAFLVTRQERLVLCVGPFPSKAKAASKLTGLKRQYRDCFIRTITEQI